MKKNISLLLAVCMSLSVCLVLTACGHTHTYETEWSKDATHHWHACEGEGCTDVADKAEHEWNGGEVTTQPTPDDDGVKTFTCTVCAGTKTEPVEYVADTTVTEDEWSAAFDLGNNFTVTMQATHPVLQQTVTGTQERDGNKFSNLQIMVDDTTGDTIGTNERYSEIVDTVWYDYRYDLANEEFDKIASSSTVAECLTRLYEGFLPQAIRDFGDYTYDEDTDSYVAESIEYMSSAVLNNVSLKFVDGKLVSFSYTMEADGASVPYTISFTYGDAEVTLPTIEESVSTTVTEQEWANAFLFEGSEYVINAVNGDITQNTEFDGSTVKVSGIGGDGNPFEQYFTIEGGNYYFYSVEGSAVRKSDASEDLYNSVKTGAMDNMFVYSNFEYDEDSESYKSIEDISMAAGPSTTLVYSDVEIKFEDGKIISVSFDFSLDGATPTPSTMTVTYGDIATITVPAPTNAD